MIDERWVYVAQFPCDMVKVGTTRSIDRRMNGVHRGAPRPTLPAVRWETFGPLDGGHLQEVASVQAVSRVATTVPRSREWFIGISFERACGIVQECVESPARLVDELIVANRAEQVKELEAEMRSEANLITALRRIRNVAEFARRHNLAERTIWRLRAGGKPNRGTLALLELVLRKESK
jgi:hypothetical protein